MAGDGAHGAAGRYAENALSGHEGTTLTKKDILGSIVTLLAGGWLFVKEIIQAWLADKLAKQLTGVEDILFDWVPFLALSAVAIWLLGYGKLWKRYPATPFTPQPPAPLPVMTVPAVTVPVAPTTPAVPPVDHSLPTLLARQQWLRERHQQYVEHQGRAEVAWEAMRSAFFNGANPTKGPVGILRRAVPIGRWEDSNAAMAKIAKEVLGTELDVRSHRAYDENPFRPAPADETVTDLEAKQDYRRLYVVNETATRATKQAGIAIQSMLSNVDARIRQAGQLSV